MGFFILHRQHLLYGNICSFSLLFKTATDLTVLNCLVLVIMLYFNQIYVRGESNCSYQVFLKLQIIFCLDQLTCSPQLVTISKQKLKGLVMVWLRLLRLLSLKIINTKIMMICIIACTILTIQKNNLPITLPALCGVRGIPSS